MKSTPRDVVDEPGETFWRLAWRNCRISYDRQIDDIDPLDQRLPVDVPRQIGASPSDSVLNVVERANAVCVQPKKNGGDRYAVRDLRLDVANAFESGNAVLDVFGDLKNSSSDGPAPNWDTTTEMTGISVAGMRVTGSLMKLAQPRRSKMMERMTEGSG